MENALNLDTVKLAENKKEIVILDQTLLPNECKYLSISKAGDIWEAIYSLRVRGAPAIGVTGAYAYYVLADQIETEDKDKFVKECTEMMEYINSSRPTAVNLSWALNRMHNVMLTEKDHMNIPDLKVRLMKEADAIREEDIPQIKKEYDALAKEMIAREKAGKGFNFFHFMIDLTGGPCVYKRLSGCGSGTEYLAVTPWGDFYPCHQFVGDENFLMGNVNEGITRPEIADEFRCCNVYTKEKCKKCFARFYCSGGCMANAYKYADGLNDSYDLGCEMERKRVECAIMIKAAMADEN